MSEVGRRGEEKMKGEEDRVLERLGEERKRTEEKRAEESRSCVPPTVKLNSVIDLSLLV